MSALRFQAKLCYVIRVHQTWPKNTLWNLFLWLIQVLTSISSWPQVSHVAKIRLPSPKCYWDYRHVAVTGTGEMIHWVKALAAKPHDLRLLQGPCDRGKEATLTTHAVAVARSPPPYLHNTCRLSKDSVLSMAGRSVWYGGSVCTASTRGQTRRGPGREAVWAPCQPEIKNSWKVISSQHPQAAFKRWKEQDLLLPVWSPGRIVLELCSPFPSVFYIAHSRFTL